MISRNRSQGWSRLLLLGFGAGVVSLLLLNPAWAQLTDYKTVVTFSAPVEVPGSAPQVLPVGSYLFKVVDSKVNRNIVQISDKDETHVYTTVLTVPTHREVETDRTITTFEERAQGEPQALRAWFYPHEKRGQEFVYSKEKAAELAKATNSKVPYNERAASATRRAPAAAALPVTAEVPAPIRTMLPSGRTEAYTQQAQATSPAPIQSREESPVQNTTQKATLPQTGTNLPMMALSGCLSVIAGLAIHALCVR